MAVGSLDMHNKGVMSFISKLYNLSTTKVIPPKYIFEGENSIHDIINYEQDTLVIVATIFNQTNWKGYLRLLTKIKIMSGILVIVEYTTSKKYQQSIT